VVYIKKKLTAWEIKYGQIQLSGSNYREAKRVFQNYMGKTFDLDTFLGVFPNRHFLDDIERNSLRLACRSFFSKLEDGDVLYFQPTKKNVIKTTKTEPATKLNRINDKKGRLAAFIQTESSTKIEEELTKSISQELTLSLEEREKIILSIVEENIKLREENQELMIYKDRLEKYQNLDYIFEDEKFMEDWLERNIHKALPNIEVIDRQISITWGKKFMRNRPDFFCLDKTTRELIIVENKVRGRFKRLETQYLTYTAWVKNHLKEINEKYKDNNLKATEDFRFVIITDTTNERLETICESHKIPLILIDGGVIFEEIVPYYFE